VNRIQILPEHKRIYIGTLTPHFTSDSICGLSFAHRWARLKVSRWLRSFSTGKKAREGQETTGVLAVAVLQ
jgi:hypothetical protein